MIRPLAGTVLFLLTFAAFSRAQQNPVVFGRVVADDSGSPLPHVRIVIYDDALPLSPIFTDSGGRFSSIGLKAGRYRLAAAKAGYTLTTVSPVIPGKPAQIRMRRSASISGRAFDAYGDPVIGLAVMIFPAEGGVSSPAAKVATTDDLGEYRAGGLPPGAYYVAVNQLSIDSVGAVNRTPMFFPSMSSRETAQALSLAPGDQRAGVDFSGVVTPAGLSAVAALFAQAPDTRITVSGPNNFVALPEGTAAIRGRITRGDGLAVARATVTATMLRRADAPPNAFAPHTTTTDDDGMYEFEGILRGDYRIRASKPGFVSALYGQRSAGDPGAILSVGEHETRARVDFTLPRHSAIVGEIADDFGDPVEGATVNAWQIRYQSGRRRLLGVDEANTAVTDDLGHFRLFGLPAGQYVVTAAIGQVSTQPGGADVGGFASTYFPGTTNPSEARLLTVARAQDTVGVNFALVPLPTARITGRRLGADGEPMSGSLTLTRSQRSGVIATPSTGARIARDGRFEFPNVAPGEYVIQADSGKHSAQREGDFVSQFVTVNGANIDNVLLQSLPGSTITGRVVFEGDPPENFRGLAIEPARADADRTPLNNGSVARSTVQRDLTFTIEGVHGPRRLVVDRVPPGWMVKTITAGGVDVTDATLSFGTRDESLSDVEVVLTNRVTRLAGTVTDARGQPATGYTVLIFPTDRDRWYVGSRFFRRSSGGESGMFVVTGLPPGSYDVAPVTGLGALREGGDAWQDPEVLDSLAFRATHVTLADGQQLSVSATLVSP